MSEDIKKYPIYYKDEEYEIRIEEDEKRYDGIWDGFYPVQCITIYKVTNQKCFLKNKKKYDKVYSIDLSIIKNELVFLKDFDSYYVKLFKEAFNRYIKPVEIKNKQLKALKEGDGVIENVI